MPFLSRFAHARPSVLVALMIAACGGAKTTASVTVEPLPSMSASAAPIATRPLDVKTFFDAGCKPTNDASLIDCAGARIPGIAKCRSPLHVLSVSFEPPAVVAECFVENATGGVRQTGCMRRSAVSLVVATRDGFVDIDWADALAKTFGPVTSRTEAVAFAVATSGNMWFATSNGIVGPSSVSEEADGYHVELFNSEMCGCSHPTSAIVYLVRRDGEVRELSRKVVWENPKSRGLCVD